MLFPYYVYIHRLFLNCAEWEKRVFCRCSYDWQKVRALTRRHAFCLASEQSLFFLSLHNQVFSDNRLRHILRQRSVVDINMFLHCIVSMSALDEDGQCYLPAHNQRVQYEWKYIPSADEVNCDPRRTTNTLIDLSETLATPVCSLWFNITMCLTKTLRIRCTPDDRFTKLGKVTFFVTSFYDIE